MLGEVQRGDRLRVRPGDNIPVDGVVLEGHSTVDDCVLFADIAPSLRSLSRTWFDGGTGIVAASLARSP